MTVRIYRSTDASAPVMSGSAGALAGVLDACLVNGYGAKAAAGWAIEFTGTNKRAYRAASGNRLRMRLDDTGTVNGRIVGYETMSDVDTGGGDFPTAAQLAGGLYVLKSSAADATARPWLLIATGTMFYLFINQSNVGAGLSWGTNIYSFGDFVSYKSSDVYGTRICGNINTTLSTTNTRGTICSQGPAFAQAGMYVARASNHVGGSINVGQVASAMITGSGSAPVSTSMVVGSNLDTAGAAPNLPGATYPNAADGGMLLGRLYVSEIGTVSIRGFLPGIWAPGVGAGTPPAFGDTWSGTGDLAGKTFEMMQTIVTNIGRIAIETSDTW